MTDVYNILLWRDCTDRAKGGPDLWPAETALVPAGDPPPPAPRLRMTVDEFAAYLAQQQPDYDAWRAAQRFAEAKAQRLADLADIRWRHEGGGVSIGGVTVPTDESMQIKITGARLAAEADPSYTVRWKVAPGDFVSLDTAAVIGLSNSVRAHIQACYNNEDALSAQINAASTTAELDAVDITAGWP